MRSLFTVIAALVMGATAYFIVSSKSPASAIGAGSGEEQTGREGAKQLTGTPANRGVKSSAAGNENGSEWKRGYPGPINQGSTAEDLAQETFEAIKNPELPLAQRLDRVKTYIADASRFLPKEEVAHRLMQLVDPSLDPSDDGSFHGGLLASLKGLKAQVLVTTLLEGVDDRRPKVRLGALTTLVDFQEDEAVRSRVRELLRDADDAVRAKAKELLGADSQVVEESDPVKDQDKRH
jgi:hypothetical protein